VYKRQIQELHKILSSSAIEEAIKESEGIQCPNHQKCLIKYFLAVGLSMNIDKEKIAEYAHCPRIDSKYLLEERKSEKRKRKNAP
jgi:DNA-directed RNA polymerase subunit RPC12/RpoP